MIRAEALERFALACVSAHQSARGGQLELRLPTGIFFRENFAAVYRYLRADRVRARMRPNFPEHRTGKIALCAFIGKEAPSIGILTEAPFSSCYARLPPLRKVA